jgi:cell division protease FtsH
MGVFILHDLWVNYQSVSTLAYSEFQKLVSEGKVKEIVITSGEIRGEFNNPEAPNKKYFRTTRVDSSLAAELAKHGVKFSGKIESNQAL